MMIYTRSGLRSYLKLHYWELVAATPEELAAFKALQQGSSSDTITLDAAREGVYIYFPHFYRWVSETTTVFRFTGNTFTWNYVEIDWDE